MFDMQALPKSPSPPPEIPPVVEKQPRVREKRERWKRPVTQKKIMQVNLNFKVAIVAHKVFVVSDNFTVDFPIELN